MGHWVYVHLGLSGTGPWYAFLSGSGSDVGELAVIGGLFELVRRLAKHNRQRLAQAARHHLEHLALVRAHHEELKAHITATRTRKGF